MEFPLIQSLARPARSKLVWAVCDGFDEAPESGSEQCALDRAATPQFDALCRHSETGLLKKRAEHDAPLVDFDAVARLSVFEVVSRGARPSLAGLLACAEHKTVPELLDFERSLSIHWNEYDLFLLRLDWRSEAEKVEGRFDCKEWIEMLDAWLTGLVAQFQPDVFALSGNLWLRGEGGSEHPASTPVLLHSSHSRARQTSGFTIDACRRGRLGRELSLRHWLLLLLAHAGRLDEVVLDEV
ncbi:MAG: hypothetical protein ACLFVC_06225 [Opitutales bacterium]